MPTASHPTSDTTGTHANTDGLGRKRRGWSLRHQIYCQFLAAVIPLLALLIYEMRASSILVRDINERLMFSQLASGAADNYRKFINGVTDASDTGELASGEREALRDTGRSLHQLLKLYSSQELRDASQAVDRLDLALAPDTSIKALLAARPDIHLADAQIKATAGVLRADLEQQMRQQQSDGSRRDWICIALTAATLMVLISILRRTVNQIAQPIGIAIDVAKRVTAGDLTGEIEVTRHDEFGELLSALMNMHYELSEIVAEVRRGAAQIGDASKEIADGTDDLARRTSEQAQSVAQIGASAEQLRASVNQNATESEQANAVAREATIIATKGGEIVNRVVSTMQSLHSGSKQVVDFIGVIEDIAFQTNILAINAAVEAARAGDSGRGFAVVASEVRELANRSARTAKDAKELIGRTFTHVNDGTKFVEQAGDTMSDIIAAVRSLAETTQAMLTASRRQQADADAVATTAQQIDVVTRANVQFVRQSESAAVGLRQRAAELNQSVDRFKVLRHVRLSVSWAARLLQGRTDIQALINSVSVSGIGFESGGPLKTDQRVLIRLQLPDNGEATQSTATSSVLIECVVAWSVRGGKKFSDRHGARLSRIAQPGRAALRTWLATELAAERRRSTQLRANFDGLAAFDRLPSLPEQTLASATAFQPLEVQERITQSA